MGCGPCPVLYSGSKCQKSSGVTTCRLVQSRIAKNMLTFQNAYILLRFTKMLGDTDMWPDPTDGAVISVDLEGNYRLGSIIPLGST